MKATTIKAVKFELNDAEKDTMYDAIEIIIKARNKTVTEHMDSEKEKIEMCLQLIKDITDGKEIGTIK